MDIYCDHCGFERHYTGAMVPIGGTCEVCGIGRMRQGKQLGGFTVTSEHQPVARNLPVRDYQPVHQGTMGVPANFNYFANEQGDRYKAFIQTNSVYVGKLTNILVPEPKRFAWLTPYTGNKHNRAHFTQLVLARVARAKFIDNKGKLPRLIEPFVGSGQIFLNASHWGPTLNGDLPLFSAVVAGDLNHYVIGAYRAMSELGDNAGLEYQRLARQWDANLEQSYRQLRQDLEQGGKAALANAANDPAAARTAAFAYIWLVNRCTRGTKLTDRGGVLGQLNPKTAGRIGAIRNREWNTINATLDLCKTIRFDFACRDFRLTCQQATETDIVFMDCPFPKFTNLIPPNDHPAPETYKSDTAHTYGTGDDGAGFQTQILNEALRLVRQGTTVILCNFANPGLIQAYARLVGNDVAANNLRYFTYTYRSPSTLSEAYQLTVLPGAWNPMVTGCPQTIINDWLAVGGDNNVTAQDFFAPRQVLTRQDREYDRMHYRQERKRQDADAEDAYVMDEDEDDEEYVDTDAVDDRGELTD